MAGEFPSGRPRVTGAPFIVAIGTLAEKALGSPLLRERLDTAGIRPTALQPAGDLTVLRSTVPFSLALVLSPFKREAPRFCDRLAPTAAATGVVDTALGTADGVIGLNTNAYAAAGALEQLLAGTTPGRVLIAGTGASARSVLVGLVRLFPVAVVGVIGRSADRAAALVHDLEAGTVVTEPTAFDADLVINATTVGETDDSATLGFDLDAAFGPGVRYFDLNNRVSALQQRALARGCVTASGVTMQVLTNALRVFLLAA